MIWLDITDSTDMSLRQLQKLVENREGWHVPVHGGHRESDRTEQLNNNNKLAPEQPVSPGQTARLCLRVPRHPLHEKAQEWGDVPHQ